jgi:hypothetical protein
MPKYPPPLRDPNERAAFTVAEFCSSHRMSRRTLYILWQQGNGPRCIRNGRKVLISIEAAADWRREREAASAQASAA